MFAREDDESDAPEEFTSLQAIQQDEEIRKLQQQSNARVRQEGKERRKKMAERLTTQSKSKVEVCDGYGDGVMIEDEEGADTSKQSKNNTGMLPNDIVNLLAAREKQVFLSDSEDEKEGQNIKAKEEENQKFWDGNCYSEEPTSCPLCAELLGVFEAKENSCCSVSCSSKQFKPSFATPLFFWLVEVNLFYFFSLFSFETKMMVEQLRCLEFIPISFY